MTMMMTMVMKKIIPLRSLLWLQSTLLQAIVFTMLIHCTDVVLGNRHVIRQHKPHQQQPHQQQLFNTHAIWKEIVAGAISGMIEIFCTYPLDIVKTRAMMKTTLDGHPKSIIATLREILATEGLMGCWRGVTSPLLCALPWRATKFMSFTQFRRLLTGGYPQNATMIHILLAGVGVGITESIILNPFEIVKISMISDQFRIERVYENSWDCCKKIFRAEGLGGFFRGYLATCYRQILFSSAYFVTYIYCLCAGIVGSIANTPMDVVKTRIQNERNGNLTSNSKIRDPIQGLIQIYRTEGFQALYSGLIPKIMRVGPGAAITFFVFEYLLTLL